jgi:hypothetical protein
MEKTKPKLDKRELSSLNEIFERLKTAVDLSEKVAFATKSKLKEIKTECFEVEATPLSINECLVDSINNCLTILEDVNRVSEANLRHLETII